MDGWELLRRQQADLALAVIAVVMLSAAVPLDATVDHLRAAMAVMRNPIDIDAVLAPVAQYGAVDG